MKKKVQVILAIIAIAAFFTNAPVFGAGQQEGAAKGKQVNINSATAEQLTTLPKIGPKTAERIIEYRKTNGNFKRIQELMKVKGIGEKTFKNLENLITV